MISFGLHGSQTISGQLTGLKALQWRRGEGSSSVSYSGLCHLLSVSQTGQEHNAAQVTSGASSPSLSSPKITSESELMSSEARGFVPISPHGLEHSDLRTRVIVLPESSTVSLTVPPVVKLENGSSATVNITLG